MKSVFYLSFSEILILSGKPDQKQKLVFALKKHLQNSGSISLSMHSLAQLGSEFSGRNSFHEWRSFLDSLESLSDEIVQPALEDLHRASDLSEKFSLAFSDSLDAAICQRLRFRIPALHPAASSAGIDSWHF